MSTGVGKAILKQAETEAQEETEEKRTLSEAHKEALQKGRKDAAERKAKEQRKATQEATRKELENIDGMIQRADLAYQASLKIAIKATSAEDIDKLFNVADRRQDVLLNSLARKRTLLAKL